MKAYALWSWIDLTQVCWLLQTLLGLGCLQARQTNVCEKPLICFPMFWNSHPTKEILSPNKWLVLVDVIRATWPTSCVYISDTPNITCKISQISLAGARTTPLGFALFRGDPSDSLNLCVERRSGRSGPLKISWRCAQGLARPWTGSSSPRFPSHGWWFRPNPKSVTKILEKKV